MACANCDHTMQCVGDNGGRSVFWCPRCGTLKMVGGVPEYEPPTNNHLWPVRNIKAAPGLLAACKAFDAWSRDPGGGQAADAFECWTPELQCALVCARAAIAKAEVSS